jgi:uncharacterized membrane protein HdeD (DUF308 family)
MDAGSVVQTIAALLIAAHVLELAVAFKYLKYYKGPLVISVILSLLFGLLHWLPLAKANRTKLPT